MTTLINNKEYREDARGNLIPVSAIKPVDLMRDELVCEIVERARELQDLIEEFKHQAMDDITAFVALSAERYGAKIGGLKGNVTLHSFDGKYRVNLAINEILQFDEGIQAAKALIDECIEDWTRDSREEIKMLIDNAFAVDKEGNISTNRVLGLRRLNIDDDRWVRAMNALSDSLRVQTSKAYVRVYQREDNPQNPEKPKYLLMNS